MLAGAPRPPRRPLPRWLPRLWIATGAVAAAIAGLEWGFDVASRPAVLLAVTVLDGVLVGLLAAELGLRLQAATERLGLVRDRWGDVLALALCLLLVVLGLPRAAGAVAVLRALGRGLLAARHVPLFGSAFALLQARPLVSLIASFAVVIAFGTLALTFPAATADHAGAPLLTAFFTATSATCVTGLAVVDTATYWSRFGQLVILGLVQIGGLGIMTITTALSMAFRSTMTLKERGAIQEMYEEETILGFRRLIVRAVGITLGLEALGAAALYLRFDAYADVLGLRGEGTVLFHAVFHAVTAFCNAGFALHSDSLVRFVGDVPVNLTVAVLAIAGGLGFPVIANLLHLDLLRAPRLFFRRLPVHDRIVWVATAALLAGGTLAYLVVEWNGVLHGLSFRERLVAASFASVTTRSAGFNTVDYGLLTQPGVILTCALMFIGGSPGGTAGGVKVTTAAVMLLAVRAILHGRPDVEVMGRELPRATIYRAVAVIFISGAGLTALLVVLFAVERHPFDQLLFEAVSAFATTGLSMNLTPKLSAAGQLVVAFLMFVGRLGPFTLALAIGFSRHAAAYRFPSGKVVVG